MGKILYLECNSGISGDMTVGALLDLGADRDVLEHALESLGVGGYHLHFGRKNVCGLDSYDFDVHLEGDGHDHGEGHGDSHGHGEGYGHSHGHEAGDEHGRGHGHGEGDEHSHDHGEGDEHSHGHGEGHGHSHPHEEPHDHAHHNHTEAQARVHDQWEVHKHVHPHEETHNHTDPHTHPNEDAHSHSHAHQHGDGHSHVHRNLFDIYQIIDRLDSNDRVKGLARKMFRIVAEAESKAHGLPLEQVHFHEVGAIDSIVDIISVAVCVDNLGVDDVVVSALAEGHGHVHCQHGVLPVPVPATANIASAYGLDLRFTDNDGEMVTPTGAAIAAALGTRDSLPDSCRLLKVGMGAGNRVFKQANVLRAMLMETSQAEAGKAGNLTSDGCSMWVMETNLDDCTGEILGFVMELLLEAGAADVWYTPIFMKKNRPAYTLSVLCRGEDREKLEEIILIHTTTIGIRQYPVTRTVLAREKMTVDMDCGQADVKVCTYKDRKFYYPEYESVRRICRETDRDFKAVYQAVRLEAERKGL